jgi:hypothetical protein
MSAQCGLGHGAGWAGGPGGQWSVKLFEPGDVGARGSCARTRRLSINALARCHGRRLWPHCRWECRGTACCCRFLLAQMLDRPAPQPPSRVPEGPGPIPAKLRCQHRTSGFPSYSTLGKEGNALVERKTKEKNSCWWCCENNVVLMGCVKPEVLCQQHLHRQLWRVRKRFHGPPPCSLSP